MKTLTGSSIQAALAEARRRLGDDVLLVESSAATDDEPARVTVMVDEEADAPADRPAPQRSYGCDAVSAEAAVPAVAGAAEDYAENGRAMFSENTSGSAASHSPEKKPMMSSHRDARSGGRGRLFSQRNQEAGTDTAPGLRQQNALLESQLKLLHERLDGLERRLGAAVIGTSRRWTAHPLYATLLEQGLRAATVTQVFGELVDRGHDPDTSTDELQWAVAQILRKKLQPTAPQRTSRGTLMLIGPSGSGKTSLILKLASHEQFYARHQPAVLVIAPEEERRTAYQCPADLYRRFGLPVQIVQTEAEMQRAVERVDNFGELLIDTPPLPLREAPARKMLRRLARLTNALMPLQIHLTLNTTRSLDDFDPSFLQHLPLRPDAAALTHLDETDRWGRIAEWLLKLERPVQFVSTGPAVPRDLTAFSPTWFVEEMMCL